MASDAARLLARGAAITLSDGVERRLIFDFEALVEIEERSGSLLTFLDDLHGGWKAKALKSVRVGIYAGLMHDRDLPRDPLVRQRMIDALINHRSIRFINACQDAIKLAIDEAIPMSDEAPASGKGSSQTSDSTGTTSITSEPSSTTAVPVSSGA